jgi:GNAT superfamily N-acetyltransferase
MKTDPPLVYENAAEADLPAVVDLCMLVEEQHENYWPLRWQRRPGLAEGYLRWMTRRLTDANMLIHVAKDPAQNGRIVGMIIISINDEIPIYTYSQYAYVQDMAVLESHRRRGIAQQLLKNAADWSRTKGLNQLRLMVAHQNPTARTAFEKAGFLPAYQEMVLPL